MQPYSFWGRNTWLRFVVGTAIVLATALALRLLTDATG